MAESKALAVRRELRVTWLDRALLSVFPGWGMRRLQARASALAYARHFDAAGIGRRQAGWQRHPSDANTAAGPSLAALRELSRDLRRNNGWAKRGIRVICNNTVGRGIKAKPLDMSSRFEKQAASLWDAWSKSVACDFDGRVPFAGLQRLVLSTIVESGEALVVREAAESRDGLPVPVRIRVLEPDYLDTYRDGPGPGGGQIVQGVEFDSRGRRVAYWLFQQHPGSSRPFGNTFASQRVTAERVLHVYDVERASQARGVPWLSAAISKLNDFDDFEDAELMQQKIAACFGAFVHEMDGLGTSIGEQDDDDPLLETLEPGHIQYLPPGKSVSFATPPSPQGGDGFSARQLRRIAAGLGVTYEDLTQDYSQVNFSSARMARLSHWANVHDWRHNMLIPQFCDGVWRWVMEMGRGLFGWSSVPRAQWTPPPMPILEPEKEGLAYQRLIRSGTQTLYDVIRERGYDPETHLAEVADANELLDRLGIILDSDPRRTTTAGALQAASSEGASGAAESDAGADDAEDEADESAA